MLLICKTNEKLSNIFRLQRVLDFYILTQTIVYDPECVVTYYPSDLC